MEEEMRKQRVEREKENKYHLTLHTQKCRRREGGREIVPVSFSFDSHWSNKII